ncbi:MAG: hypothetical protein EBR34_11845 [Sphingomonadaceae bacterium]|nr:hypothetical protein [Sphingomonadaceae bacterium]
MLLGVTIATSGQHCRILRPGCDFGGANGSPELRWILMKIGAVVFLGLAVAAACPSIAQDVDAGVRISDHTDNVQGTRHMAAIALATGPKSDGDPSLYLGCDGGPQPKMMLLFDRPKAPKDETAVKVSFLKHRTTLNYPVSLWKPNLFGQLLYPGDLDQFAADADESFTIELVVTTERGREVYAYGGRGYVRAVQYLRANCHLQTSE